MPDDHSELVPLLPIPNRTVKRLCADDSGRTSVKVGHRQAFIPQNPTGTSCGVLSSSEKLCSGLVVVLERSGKTASVAEQDAN